jgi:hypothetical protein
LEALYDSAGRPLQLASIEGESMAPEGGDVEVLFFEFRPDQAVTLSRLVYAREERQAGNPEEMAFSTFVGTAYLTRIAGLDSSALPAALVRHPAERVSSKDAAKARALANELWKFQCPWHEFKQERMVCRRDASSDTWSCVPDPDSTASASGR